MTATLFTPLLSAASAAAVPAGKARAVGAPLDCSGGTIYAYQRGASATASGTLLALDASTLGGATPSSVTATVVSTIPGASGAANALGVTRGGLAAYVVDQTPAVAGSVNLHGYNVLTQTRTTYTGTATGPGDSFVAGAVNRANGIYYYASFAPGTTTTAGTATLYGFNTATNTAIPGIIGTFKLPIVSNQGLNGDIAFDALGNLYALASVGTAAGIGRVSGPLPTTGSTSGTALTSTVTSTLPDPDSNSYNGVAFNNAGQMYVEFTGAGLTSIEAINHRELCRDPGGHQRRQGHQHRGGHRYAAVRAAGRLAAVQRDRDRYSRPRAHRGQIGRRDPVDCGRPGSALLVPGDQHRQ